MAPSKLEVDKFDGHDDFSMWRKKMKAVLVQYRCTNALVEIKEEKDKQLSITAQERQDMDEIVFSLIILSLADNVLRQVNEEELTANVWSKLESLYMTKSLTNKIFLKE